MNEQKKYVATFLEGNAIVKISIVSFLLVCISCMIYIINSFNPATIYYVIVLWIFTVLLSLWFGNNLISKYLNKYYPWQIHLHKRFFIQLLASAIYSLLCLNVTYYGFKVYFTSSTPELSQIFTMNIYGLLFVIPVISINFGVFFMNQWKSAFVQSEELKKENIKSQYEALKSHIDPHFLFNNLNILSALIDNDTKVAQEFLNSFSDVYRYVLDNKKTELVSLKTELHFIKSYVYMLENRFSESLTVSFGIDKKMMGKFIPPLSVQMLLENVIKHNTLSKGQPLKVEIFTDLSERVLVIRNNFQQRNIITETHHSGLNNIQKRYNYLSDRMVDIQKTKTHFTVKLPLLNIDE